MKKTNILCFVADQMRCDSLNHMGNKASITPRMDAIVNEGVSFQNAYCQNPVCVPSRCSFLSGLYPHTTGHRTMHFLQNEDEQNILRTMKENGYEVIWIGRNDVVSADRSKLKYCDEYYDGINSTNEVATVRHERQQRFEKEGEKKQKPINLDYSFYIGKIDQGSLFGQYDWNCVQNILDYLDRKSKEKDSKPFFVYCTITFPHPPYACEDPWYSSIQRDQLQPRRTDINELKDKASMLYQIRSKQNLGNYTEEQFNELRATYLAMVSRFDHQFGLISDKLKECDFYDNTSLFVYSDHGDYTGDYTIVEKVQNCFENPISNVPLLVKPAKGIEVNPRISKALVELVDIPATIMDFADIQPSYTHFGQSLRNTLAGSELHKDAVICEGGRIHGEEHAMETGHGPSSPYWPRLSSQCSEGPEHTKACMIRMENYKYTLRLYEKDEFYNLDQDPMELINEIENPIYQEQIQKMKNRLLNLYMETNDVVPNRKDLR